MVSPGGARAIAIRVASHGTPPETPTEPSPALTALRLQHTQHVARYQELRAVNPVLAARYAVEHGVHEPVI